MNRRGDLITLRVNGTPAPQGSKTFKGHARNGRAILTESSQRVKPWRSTITANLRAHMGRRQPLTDAVHIDLAFVMPRPKSTPKRTPTPAAIKRPDIDKLCRAILDAITGIAIHDDSQVTHLKATKRIAEPDEQPGVTITITQVDTP